MLLSLLPAAVAMAAPVPTKQLPIARVERMPTLPEPLAIRDWRNVARSYYLRILDPRADGQGFPAVKVEAGQAGFRMKSYLGGDYTTEAFTCLMAVAGAKLVGLEPRAMFGEDWPNRCKAWFDPRLGLYRHHSGDRSLVVHADIYGYWAAIQGLMLAAVYPDDADFAPQALRTVQAFRTIAKGCGCPDQANFDVLGWDFGQHTLGGRDEPMNRFGHAASVAWPLMVGHRLTGDGELLSLARAALRWQIEHPGRYEVSHMMGPLAAARANVEPGDQVDLSALLKCWFGDGDSRRHSWWITAGLRAGGLTLDGLDGARWGNDGFYAFTMGTLQGPAWLVPVVRYDQRYARAVARYALHAANSARLLQGAGLGADHQDHARWKAKHDPDNLFFYEGLKSWDPTPARKVRPYATGDPVLNGWLKPHPKVDPQRYFEEREAWFGATCDNLALYMGNSVGLLGGIVRTTDVAGILDWDCLATDWHHGPALPTRLVFNPHADERLVMIDVGGQPVDLYDTIRHTVVARGARGLCPLKLAGDAAAVLVCLPQGAPIEARGGRAYVGQTVIDYRP